MYVQIMIVLVWLMKSFFFCFWQNLKDVLADLVPKEQNRIKNFKQQHGKTNIGQITVDMVSCIVMLCCAAFQSLTL